MSGSSKKPDSPLIKALKGKRGKLLSDDPDVAEEQVDELREVADDMEARSKRDKKRPN
jgi:hypothetical protein